MSAPVEYKVVNPATGETEAECPSATDEQIEHVLARANAAYQSWRTSSKTERAAMLNRVADLYEERREALGSLITREMGKTTGDALGEVDFVADIYRYYANNGADLLKDEPLPSETPGE